MVNDIMAKKFNSVWRLLLGSFITLLGFGSCKTAKNVQQPKDDVVLYGAPPVKIEKQEPPVQVERQDPGKVMRLLYGPPPVRKIN